MVASDLVEITEGGNTSKSVTGTKIIDMVTSASVVTANTAKVTYPSSASTKLAGIEASATADQTDAEIRAAVEAATDSNVFTDTDHTKLNAIEASATADQTNDEIKAAIEAASDSNTFTDADHTKLNAIEASADVTDSTNVVAALTAGTGITIASNGTIAAGPLAVTTVQVASSESAQLALTAEEGDVVVRSDEDKTYMHNSGTAGTMDDYTLLATPTGGVSSVNSVTGTVTAAHIATAVEAASGSNTFTDADHTKLNAIEASADVTDATNVTAAGALMDSELAGIAAVKATTGTFLTADQSKLDGIAASANNYVHPNHSGEVTSTADGATVVADNVVDEANLKVSNSPTNAYVLTAQSGASGGLTWAEAAAGGYTAATSAPSSPSDGDHWFDTATGILYVRVASNWIDVNTAASGPAAAAATGGSMTHVSTATVSGTSTAEVIVAVDNTYKTYKIYASWEVRADSNSSIEQRFTDGGTAVTDNAAYTGARQYNGAGSAVNGNGKMVTAYPDSNLPIASQEWTIFMDGNNIKKVIFSYGITRANQGSSVVAQGTFSPHNYSASGNIDGISWKSPNTQFKAGSTFILYGLAE